MFRKYPVLMAFLIMCAGYLPHGQPVTNASTRGDGAELVPASVTGSLQNPAWSPNGQALLFTRFRVGYNRGLADLLVLDLASSNTRTLVADGTENINLPGSSWNPVTGQIVFASTREPHDEIYSIHANGEPGSESRVTHRTGLVAYEPSFSPDGEWVVFESHVLDVEGNGVIVKYKVDGTSPYTPLTNSNGDARQPNWSPAGGLIVYQSLANGQWDLWVMNADGTVPRKVTSGTGNKTDASFSPDGKWIVYSYEEANGNGANLYVISMQGGTPSRVTNFGGYDGAPSWSPDGKQIVFESSPSDPDGSTGTKLWKIAVPSLANVYYVSPSGNDSNPGAKDRPWRTIQKAAKTLVAGETVYLRGGTYAEQLSPENSGAEGAYITYAAYPGETVTLDGATVSLPEWDGLVNIINKAYIRISGLRVVNAGPNTHNLGILSDGSNHIIIENNFVSHTNDSGIGVWSSNHVTVTNNEVEQACLEGYNESISIGVTDVFTVSHNRVHHSQKEGITLKDGSSNGTVFGNEVYQVDSVGFYVDAEDKHTFNIEVFRNLSHDNTGNGFALASEQGGLLENVKVYNNVAYGNMWMGLQVMTCCSTSHPMQNIQIVNNTFVNNGWDPWGGGIALDNPQAQGVLIRNNLTSQNLSFQVAVSTDVPAENFTIDYNLIDGFHDGEDEVRGDPYVEGDPRFVNAAARDFHLLAVSPAIDSGLSTDAPITDFDGRARPSGAGIDIGAFEFWPTLTMRSQGSYDGWVLESSETSNEGGTKSSTSATIKVGDDALNRQFRGILSFNTASIPDNAVITKVTLHIRNAGLVGTNPFKTHKGLWIDIRNGQFGTSLRLQLSDFHAKASKNLAGQFSSTLISGWYTATLGSVAFPYINKTGATQFRLRFYKDDNNDFGADYFKFYSGNAGAASSPQLVVEYYVP